MKKKHIVLRDVNTTGEPIRSFDVKIPALLQRIYQQRGITGQAQLQKTLTGLPAPELLKGMEQAVQLLITALHQRKKICVVGDYDADGATSSALAIHALRAMNFNVDFLVPNRFEYGYGLTPEIVEEVIRLQQPDIIVTVDNGISSWPGIALARERGLCVIVTDHHLPGKTLPDANAIVNPNQPGCEFPSKNIAGVGVIFYVMSALRKKLREENYFFHAKIREPNMADYLDLVALGTVADVVTLDFTNRILVQQGLLRIRANKTRPGILALMDVARRNPRRLVAEDLGFAIAPRLNAAGRMDDMSTGIRCLLSNHLEEAQQLATELDRLNQDRKSIEKDMQQEAIKIVEQLHLEVSTSEQDGLPWGLCVYDESWHQGIVGLLASRLKERYHRPVIAFAPAGNNDTEQGDMLKGSARSIDGLHIRDVLEAIATEEPSLLEKFGGHAMAAGLSLPKKNLTAFQKAFDKKVRQLLDENLLRAVVLSDGELHAQEFHLDNAQALRNGGPWGQHFSAPLFHGKFIVMQKRLIGEQHLKLMLQPAGAIHELPLLDAIVFFIDPLLKQSIEKNSHITIAYQLDVNEYQGEDNLQLTIVYLELAG